MPTTSYRQLWQQLVPRYDESEAKAIVRMVLDMRFGLSMAAVYSGGVEQLSADRQSELARIMHRLTAGEPVQYVLGEAPFAQDIYKVRAGVLIPRPETEELVDWISPPDTPGCLQGTLLDMGTGSGCIAITLAKRNPQVRVTGWDLSPIALSVAAENARRLQADVTFERKDILKEGRSEDAKASLSLPPSKGWDLIVSNPPYICEQEKSAMHANVLEHEPCEALFVPDSDPLLFYRAIADFSMEWLKNEGKLYFEINPLYARELTDLLTRRGYTSVETRCDAFGKERFIKATWKQPEK
ncbi:MAG: peptide chain release factor N(5)-glutamine methyltransferase [Paludibacteraceae bacterium]|nr:peptide chain release factor N(5)-glutamine methyltransferase [Paludibacteraceae bacterium]